MVKCCKCKELKPEESFYKDRTQKTGRGSYCKDCFRAYNSEKTKKDRDKYIEKSRNYRERNKNIISEKQKIYQANNREKIIAHGLVRRALEKGTIIKKELCEKCGEPSVLSHHEDYSKPLDIMWLCLRCHQILHCDKKSQPISHIKLS
jgi:ribosomal protein S27AE